MTLVDIPPRLPHLHFRRLSFFPVRRVCPFSPQWLLPRRGCCYLSSILKEQSWLPRERKKSHASVMSTPLFRFAPRRQSGLLFLAVQGQQGAEPPGAKLLADLRFASLLSPSSAFPSASRRLRASPCLVFASSGGKGCCVDPEDVCFTGRISITDKC